VRWCVVINVGPIQRSRIVTLIGTLIATTQQISGPALRVAILAGTAHRNLTLSDAFAVPDEAVWRRGEPRPERTGERQLDTSRWVGAIATRGR
jgi:hypothetical protein